TERRSMAAERETADRLIAHFLADRIGATFEGRISGATRAGLFVKLDETGADGFIPARTIGDDYFRYHEGKHALIGDRTGEAHRLRHRVTVRLGEAAPGGGGWSSWPAAASSREIGTCGAGARRTAPGRGAPRASSAEGADDERARRLRRPHAALARAGDVARLSRPLPELRPGPRFPR